MSPNNKKPWHQHLFTKKNFFFAAYAALLCISIPHMAYFFASFSDGSKFEWGVAIGAAIVVEGSIYISTYAVYKKLEEELNWGNTFKIFLLVVWNLVCSGLSWLSNVVHAVHFSNPSMLSGTDIIPFHQYFPEIAGAWPILGIVFAVVSKTVVEPPPQPKDEPEDTRTPEQIREEADREIAKINERARIEKARAAAAGSAAGTRVRSGLGGVIGGLVQGARDAFSQQPIEEDDEEEEPDEKEKENTRLKQDERRLRIVGGGSGAGSRPITFPESSGSNALAGSAPIPASKPAPPAQSIDIEHHQGLVAPVAPPRPVTIPQPSEPAGITEVQAVDVGYSFGKPKIVYNKIPYATLGTVFRKGDDVVNKTSLNRLWQMSRIPSSLCLLVVMGTGNKVRMIVDSPKVRDKLADIIADLEQQGIFLNQ